MRHLDIPPHLRDDQTLGIQDLSVHVETRSNICLTRKKKQNSIQLDYSKNRYSNQSNSLNSNLLLHPRKSDPILTTQNQTLLTLNQDTPKHFLMGRRPKYGQQFKQLAVHRGLANKVVKRKKCKELKDVITHQKIIVLKQTFIDKIRRNNPFSTPIQHQFQDQFRIPNIFDQNGFDFPQKYQKTFIFFSLINLIMSIFIFTLALVFPEIEDNVFTQVLSIVGLFFFLFEILVNFTIVRFSLGKKLQTFKEIGTDYLQEDFYLDFINIIVIFCNVIAKYPPLAYFRLVTLLKFGQGLKKLQKLEVYFIQHFYNEQYWALFKVFIFNFCFAHILSILLIAMVNLNPNKNWMVVRGITDAPWFEKYIWAYYWGTTVMLTIGFGDIVPASYQQACCMILIETFSCVILSYNISCVGTLISNIRSQDIEKGKNLKIFKKLAQKNNIDDQLSWKINNYIEQHANIKKLFNLEEQIQFVETLPKTYKIDFLKSANRTVFQSLCFFNNLMDQTIFSLAQKIEMKITHPSEIILNFQNYLNIFILKNGQVGYISSKSGRIYSQYISDKLSVKSDESNPLLLHTNFITKSRPMYFIKSIIYSALYCLPFESLLDILNEKNLDFEMYCQMKDKDKYKINQFEVVSCQYCKTKHTKFICPKLHFIPMQKHVIDRYIHKEKICKNARITIYQRQNSIKQSCLKKYLHNKRIYAVKQQETKNEISIQKKKKKENFIIEQLKPLDTVGSEKYFKEDTRMANHMEDNFAKMQSKFIENATEIIKVYMSKIFDLQNGDDSIWLLDSDRMKNYKSYFRVDNPCNLQVKFNAQIRKRTIINKFTRNFQRSINEDKSRHQVEDISRQISLLY